MKKRERQKRLEKLLVEKYDCVKEYLNLLGVPYSFREDVLQDTFIAAYRHINQLKKPENMERWLYRIAFRKMLHYRKTYRLKQEKEEPLLSEEQLGAAENTGSDDILWIHHRSVTSRELSQMVRKLGYPASPILRLRFRMGFKLSEISKTLGMNYNTVKTVERRAMKRLRHMIEK